MSDGPVLAFDTSAAHCAAALLLEGQVFTLSEAMGRGQAERLMPLIQELLNTHDLAFDRLSRIGVGVGPGNFTGIRISVSAARGLALSLGVPAVGISGLAALREGNADAVAAIAGPRDTAYVQTAHAGPQIMAQSEVPVQAIWMDDPDRLVASMARLAALADPGAPPAPMYIRAADAAPSKDTPPVILE